MRRIAREDLIIYVERYWKLSLLLFVLGMGCLTGLYLDFPAKPSKDPPPRVGIIMMGGAFLLTAFIFQFKRRAIVIDSAHRVLLITDRIFVLLLHRREYPLDQVQVRTSSFAARGHFGFGRRLNFIWLDIPGQPNVLFEGNIPDRITFQDRVTQLRKDLERPRVAS